MKSYHIDEISFGHFFTEAMYRSWYHQQGVGKAYLSDFMSQKSKIQNKTNAPAPILDAIRPNKISEAGKAPRHASAVPFNMVSITDHFWTARITINRNKTIPSVLEKCREGRISNFINTSEDNQTEFKGIFYDDSDLYKVLEGIAYSLQSNPDDALESIVDNIIGHIAGAQWDDGYLNTYYSLPKKQHDARWHDLKNKHELYCAGHLIEAAIAYYQATGKTTLINIATKFASYITEKFGHHSESGVPGHQEIEIALIKLSRLKKNTKYLKLAKKFLDQRGHHDERESYGEYAQDHLPITEQTEAVGHAVRAVYMYCAMTDIAMMTNAQTYIQALDALWDNVVTKKMYITGGIGARHALESFGDNYELPNKYAYSETCAAIGSILWNHRMFQLKRESRYIDIIETTLYNAFSVSTAPCGEAFFYVNPLESDGEFLFNKNAITHQPWFDCSCCPTNIVRFVPTIGEYIFAQYKDELYVNLYIASKSQIEIHGQKIGITIETKYPKDGEIKINIAPESTKQFKIKLRIPSWTKETPLPGDLYKYLNPTPSEVVININDQPIQYQIVNGYAVIDRIWHAGDTINIDIPMPIQQVISHEKVQDNHDKVALQRGPIVYCAESIDNAIPIPKIDLGDNTILKTEYQSDLLTGNYIISGQVASADTKENQFIAIPYYAWAHRGKGKMAVWLKRSTT